MFVILTQNLLYVSTSGNCCAVWLLNDYENPYKNATAKYYTQAYGYNSGTSDKLCFYFRKSSSGNWSSDQSFNCAFMAITR